MKNNGNADSKREFEGMLRTALVSTGSLAILTVEVMLVISDLKITAIMTSMKTRSVTMPTMRTVLVVGVATRITTTTLHKNSDRDKTHENYDYTRYNHRNHKKILTKSSTIQTRTVTTFIVQTSIWLISMTI